MDNRIAEVEKMITDCNARTQVQRQLSAQSAQNWKAVSNALQQIQRAAEKSILESKNQKTPVQQTQRSGEQVIQGKQQSGEEISWETQKFKEDTIQKTQQMREQPNQKQPESTHRLICNKCGKPLRAGVRFCRHCGNRVEVSVNAQPQPVSAKYCVCGQRIISGAKFCRYCGRAQGNA
jgi:hypothetical protein